MSTTTYFYDGQIRRYLLQIVRLLSNFAVRYSDGTLVRIPVTYADPDRQVAHIINQNSENTVQSAPRIAIYLADLELDTNRLSDASYVGKINIRERAYDEETGEYLNYQGGGYTVERLMPTPYKLTVKVDIWSTSTDQKLQILEQILMLFNPSLELQTTDNYVDWTSLTVVDLVQTTMSSRTVPVGTTDQIDIATLTLATPIYISPPAKVKRLGIVTSIISNVFSNKSEPYGDYAQGLGVDPQSSEVAAINPVSKGVYADAKYDIEVSNSVVSGKIQGTARLLGFDGEYPSWEKIIVRAGNVYTPGLSRIHLTQKDGNVIVGYFTVNPLDEIEMSINWDEDTYPTNTEIESNYRSSTTTFDAVINPKKTGPRDPRLPALSAGSRYLLVDGIGGGVRNTIVAETKLERINTNILANKVNDHRIFVNGIEVGSGSLRIPNDFETGNYYIILDDAVDIGSEIKYELYLNEDGPDAWKNLDGSDFIAEENDVVEWNGSSWSVIFSADENQDKIVYMTNIFSGTQYKWNGVNWSKSFEGVYRQGEWRLEL
jgi:hypothetical protein